jgi:hypothetical protein
MQFPKPVLDTFTSELETKLCHRKRRGSSFVPSALHAFFLVCCLPINKTRNQQRE